MSTTLTTPDRRHYLTPSSPAQCAYAVGCAIFVAGLAVIAAPGVPSLDSGIAVLSFATMAFLIGGLIEGDIRTMVTSFVGAVMGVYVIDFAVTQPTYSHTTLRVQFLVIVALTLAVGSLLARWQERTGR